MASHHDPFILQCCLENRRQPYIGINSACDKNAIFCIEHSCHINNQGLIHEMLPLRQFKRKIDERKFCMQDKISILHETFSRFIDRLIQQIRQIKLRKSLQLSMLWLRDLASSEEEYEVMKKIYRMDFEGLNCRDINSIYYKIIHNQALYSKNLNELSSYQGICKALQELSDSKTAIKLLSEKLTQIEGVLTNGQILKKILPDQKQLLQNLKQVLLEPQGSHKNFQISYNKSKYVSSTPSYLPFSSKYCLISHITYHMSIKTKYSNIMVGICNEKIKKNQTFSDLHYNQGVIVYNFANGNTYKEGMFISGSNQGVKGLNEVNIKLRLTDNQIFIMTKKKVLMRERITKLGKNLYLLCMARTEGDSFEIHCDNDISADNVNVLNLIKQQQEKEKSYESLTIPKINTKQLAQKSNQINVEDVSQNYQAQLQRQSQKYSEDQNLQFHKTEKVHKKIPPLYEDNPKMAGRPGYALNGPRLGQINEEQSRMECTTGDFRDRSAINDDRERNSFGRVIPKESVLNAQINKIKSDMNSLKQSIKGQQISQKKRAQMSQNWRQQKDTYLRDIKQRLTHLRHKGKQPQIRTQSRNEQNSKSKSTSRKNSSRQGRQIQNKLYTESSAYEKVKTGSEADNSKIKINLSDQASDFTSLIKMSLFSGPRKRSDDIVIDQEKLKANCQMTESMQPQEPWKNDEPIKMVITPPKIQNFEQRYKVNESFQF